MGRNIGRREHKVIPLWRIGRAMVWTKHLEKRIKKRNKVRKIDRQEERQTQHLYWSWK